MTNEVINVFQKFRDDTGKALENGTITFNVNLSTTLDTIFSDEALTIPQANPYTLDAAGRIIGDVKYIGTRRLVINDKSGAHIRTLDNIRIFDEGAATKNFATVAAMVAETTLKAGDLAQTSNYYSTVGVPYKGGGGRYDIIVAEASEDLGIYHTLANGLQARLILDHGNVIRTDQFGVFADWLEGDTPQQVQIQRAVDAVIDGGILSVPPVHAITGTQSSGYFCTAKITIAKYITVAGIAPTCGFRFGSLFIFEDSSGFEVSHDYVTFADLQIYGSVTPTVVTTDPSTDTWGNVGIHLGVTAACPNFVMNNCIVASFGTGLLSDSETFHDPYYKFTTCRWFSNMINISLLGTFGGSDFVNCDIRIALQHGLYARATQGVFFDNCLFEQNGTFNIDFDTGTDPEFYGIFLQKGTATKADLRISNTYYENMSGFADVDTRLTLINSDFNNAVRIFGAGDIIHGGNTTPSLIPADVYQEWGFSGGPFVTDQITHTRVIANVGTSITAFVQDFDLSNKLAVQDIKQMLISIDVKVANGFQDGSFTLEPVLRIDQIGGGSDNTSVGTNYRGLNYDFTDADWHTIAFMHGPRFDPVGNLDPADETISFLQTSVVVTSSDFSVNNLELHIRNPVVKFINDTEVRGDHPLEAGTNAFRDIVQSKFIQFSGLTGGLVTWSAAIPAGSVVLGVSAKVTRAVTGATSIDIGTTADIDLFIDGMAIADETTATPADANAAFTGPLLFKTATDIEANAIGGVFTDGDLAIKLYYIRMIAPIL